MLTLILLVVLGGGLGLLAVSMAERQPATDRGEHRRGDDTPMSPDPDLTSSSPGQPLLVRRPPAVQKSQTAIEGAYGDVAVAPLPRRVLALAGIVLLVLAVAVIVAVVIGATVAAGVELFDQTFR